MLIVVFANPANKEESYGKESEANAQASGEGARENGSAKVSPVLNEVCCRVSSSLTAILASA